MLGDREDLFPSILPYHVGDFPTGDGHTIYYEESGNPHGIPVLYVHGGPGSGCDETARQFFHPKKCNIILFDQRGSGKSRPAGATHANTTFHLAGDMRKLLDHLGHKKALIFGGSWG